MPTVPMPESRSIQPYQVGWGHHPWPRVAIGGLLLVALAYYLWFGLTLRTIDAGDGISALVSQGVLEHGYQLTPSGYTYQRGWLSHYLIAGAMGVFGVNNFSLMLPHLVFALGSLFMVYRIGTDILNRPWLGVGAAVLLLALSIQTWYATGPRMYMSLQFFTVLAVYCGWRGYIQGKRRYQWLTFLALIAGTLSNQQGATVALALPLALLVVLRLRGEEWRDILSVRNLVTVLLLGAMTLFLATFHPGNPGQLVIGHAGIDPDRIGPNLNPINWGRHVLHLERSIPYSLGLFLVAGLALFTSLRRRLDPEHRWTYLSLAFAFAFLVFASVIRSGGHRLTLFLIPMYAILVCGGAAAVVSLLAPRADSWLRVEPRGRVAAILLLAVGLTTSVSLATLKQIPFRDVRSERQGLGQFMLDAFGRGPSFGGLLRDGYGLPCGYGWRCDRRLERFFAKLRASLGPADLVVSVVPFETHYLLGRVDGWLFFRRDDREYPTLGRSPTDEYFGVPIIDTLEELRSLIGLDRRVWLITHLPESRLDAGREVMWAAIEEHFSKFDEGNEFVVYVSSR